MALVTHAKYGAISSKVCLHLFDPNQNHAQSPCADETLQRNCARIPRRIIHTLLIQLLELSLSARLAGKFAS